MISGEVQKIVWEWLCFSKHLELEIEPLTYLSTIYVIIK